MKIILSQIIIIPFIIMLYKMFIDDYLNIKMGANFTSFHYIDNLINIYRSLFIFENYVKFLKIILGQFSVLIIASYGLVISIFVGRYIKNKPPFNIELFYDVKLLLRYSLIGLLISGSLLFTSINDNTNDHFFHLRYLDLILMPILIIGLSENLIDNLKYISTTFVLVLFGLFLNIDKVTNNYFNFINLAAFWPIYLHKNIDIFMWGLSSLLILIVFMTSTFNKLSKLLIYIILSSFCYYGGYKHHRGILDFYSNPTNLVLYFNKYVDPLSCVGFDKNYPEKIGWSERYNLYLFYLFKYNIKYMDYNNWKQNCDGPYFSYNPEIYDLDIIKIGYELKSELYLYHKKSSKINHSIENENFIFIK
jgi:hypothetical protein